MEWVLCESVFIFSVLGKSVLCISLFNCVGFPDTGLSDVGFSNTGSADVGFSNTGFPNTGPLPVSAAVLCCGCS
ncbi:hypothetical protein [Eisenbergiella tayi]|uniref:hypothetical protein n=1 Tax=Eisenbergiella tayi TaxID=1432052 RepID=UPI00114CBA72